MNFRIWLSSFALPLSQTLSLRVDEDAVLRSRTTRSPARARPTPAGTCRSASNCRTAGAGMQHSACGGLSDAAFSPSGIVAGRWKTHTLSCESTATPPTWPVTHLFGSACDHSGSGSKSGTCGRLV